MIPAFNEAVLLPRLLATLTLAAGRCPGGVDQVELIVADNASTDATAEIARRHGCRVVPVKKRAIAAARNGGARIARGEVLCFIDADMQIHPETFLKIRQVLQSADVIGGATGMTSERWSPGIVATWTLLLPGVWLMGIDGGLVFFRRDDFHQLQGYREDKLAAEDVELLLRLKQLGRTRQQSFVRLAGVKAIVSTRKFDRYGDWHQLGFMMRQAWLSLTQRRDQMDRLIRSYWYEDR